MQNNPLEPIAQGAENPTAINVPNPEQPIVETVQPPSEVQSEVVAEQQAVATPTEPAAASGAVPEKVVVDSSSPTVESLDSVPETVIKDDTKQLVGDDIYIREVQKVIKQDAEAPFVEEEDAETISVDYMKNRFNVTLKREDGE